MFSNLCYRYHYNRSRTFKLVVCLLLLFYLFSAFVIPVHQAEAVAFAPAVWKGATMIFDMSIVGLIASGAIAADTEIKKTDEYKFVSAYLGYCTQKELDRLADLATTAGTVATSTISDLLSLMLGTFGTATVEVKNYDSRPSWFPTTNKNAPPSATYMYVVLHDLNFNSYGLCLATGGFDIVETVENDVTVRKLYCSDATLGEGKHYSAYWVSSPDWSNQPWSWGSFSGGWPLSRGSNVSCEIVRTGAVTLGTVLNPGVDLSKPISLTDTFAIPSDVQTCDDSWANDDTYKVAYPPWLADMDVAGDVVINPSLDHAGEGEGDIGGDVTGDLTADGSAISGAITGLWDWLKGILQSILDAIKAIPGLITGLLQSIWDAIKSLPAAIASAFSTALTAILDAVLAIPAVIASIFDVTQFQLDFTPFKSLVIKDKFPFCIPFDFRNAVKSFASTASDYQMRIDLETSFFEIHHTVDLSPFVVPIAFFRYAACVWFTLVLITRTKDLMKW